MKVMEGEQSRLGKMAGGGEPVGDEVQSIVAV